MPLRVLTTAMAGILLGALVAGCGGAVPVAVPTPTPAAEDACRALAQALPDSVRGEDSRPTDPESDLTFAWGDPAITLRCGVQRPDQLTPTSDTAEVNGVPWLPIELTNGYRFVTTGRVAYVEVDVPDTYAPEIDVLVDLAAAVDATIPLAPPPVT